MRKILFVAIIFLLSLQSLRGGDLFWHLKTGDTMLQSGTLLRHDPFSHTMQGHPLAVHAPLFQIIVATLFKIGGWPLLVTFGAALNAALFWVLYTLIGKNNKDAPWIALAAASLLLLAWPQLSLHPQFFSYLFSAILLLLLQRQITAPSTDNVAFAAIVLLLWPLLHPGFAIGIPLAALIVAVRPNRATLMIAGVTLVAMFGLYGFAWNNLSHHLGDTAMLTHIKYWLPTWKFFGSSLEAGWIGCNLVALTLLASWTAFKDKRTVKQSTMREWRWRAIVAASLLLGFSALRFFPLALFLAGPLCIRAIKRPLLFWGAHLLITAILAFTSPRAQFGIGLARAALPVGCADFVEQRNPPGQLYNSYNFGGYWLWRFGPAKPVFIDPRSSQLYPQEFFERFVEAYRNFDRFEELVQKYNVGYTVLASDSSMTKPLRDYLDTQPRWERAYADDVCVVHLKKL